MKPAPFSWRRAGSLDEAVALLAEASGGEDEARAIAGGQSLGPMLNLRIVRPAQLIDIHRVDALRAVETRNDGSVRIGACVTHARLEDALGGDRLPGRLGDFVRHVASGIAYRAIRSRGTIGGSLAHADPAADWPVALAASGATIEIAGATGMRREPAAQFGRGLFETALQPGELITAIELPAQPVARWGYRKHCRKQGEFAHALAACVDRHGRNDAPVQVWLGATGAQPVSVNVDLLAVLGRADTAAARRHALRDAIAASLPSWIDQGDAWARHLHCQGAAEAVMDMLQMD